MKKQYQEILNRTLSSSLVFLWLVLLLPSNLFFQSILSNHIIISVSVFISACFAGISMLIAIINKRILQITITDILVTCYFIYTIFNAFIIRPNPVTDILILEYLLVAPIYVSVRMMTNKEKNYGLTIIMSIGILEAIFIMLQAYGLLESRHLLFNFTGSFFNPGLVGCFIACSLCISIYYLITIHQPLKKIFIGASSALLSYTLMLTNSRAGWLAAIIGICYLLWNSKNNLIILGRLQLKKSFIAKIILMTTILCGIIFFYHYKKASADGRLFIWKVGIEMVKEKPLTGHGIGMFRSKFPLYQATFFKQNPNSNNAFVAGNPDNPFNEYLSILIMQGFIGFTLLIIALLSIYIHHPVSKKQRMQQAFLLTFCVFAFFSYPIAHYRTLILFPFFAAILPAKQILTSHNQKIRYTLFTPIVLLGMYFSVRTINEYSKLEQAYELQYKIANEKYDKIKYDSILLENYYIFVGSKLPNTEEFNIIKDYVDLYPSPTGLCELGRGYKAINDFNQAKECFIFASNINPSLITPYYELFLLYQEEGDINNMKKTGEMILHKKIKKESTTSIKIKANVKKALNKLQNHKKGLH